MNILLVEDDLEIQGILAELLALEGHEVFLASNGREALDLLRRGPTPQVILLDLMMPVMNGWDFRVRQLQSPAIAGIPVIVMTGVDEPPLPISLRPAAYLRKPLEFSRLVAVIAEVGSRA